MSDTIVKDSHGSRLNDGDAVTVIKDLKVKGSADVLKRGTLYKNIRLTEDEKAVEVGAGKSALVLKTCFLKKA
jgi:protein PhnA